MEDFSGGNDGSKSGSPKIGRSSSYLFSNNNEHAQTFFIDHQAPTHHLLSYGSTNNLSIGSMNIIDNSPTLMNPRRVNRRILPGNFVDMYRTMSGTSLDRQPERLGRGSTSLDNPNDFYTIRFQVVVWNIGKLDVVTSSVPVTFRVSMFWNDTTNAENNDDCENDSASLSSSNSVNVWKMYGRKKAIQEELKDLPQKAVEVPKLSILNCSTFETIGSPEVEMLRESSRLMRWTCMYRAIVIQENLRVDRFPHDDHDIYIKLAIISERGHGKQWDRRFWKLALATKEDTQNSTKVPHGLIVDQARLPGFSYNRERGLEFHLCTLENGLFASSHDTCLKVSLNVLRESGYYDKNIVPLLALMNVVAVSVLTFKDTEFFYRALIILNIAFVAMSIRMTADSHLPSVGYEIRLQRILNEFFFVLMCLVLEASAVYVLSTSYEVSADLTRKMDWATGILAIIHNILTLARYYESKRRAQQRLDYGWTEAPEENRKGLT
jgi:hypothetical protein